MESEIMKLSWQRRSEAKVKGLSSVLIKCQQSP